MGKKKLLFIAPHLSTGGMPQYLYKQIEVLKNDFEIWCIEWDNVTGGKLVVQRNRIFELLGKNLITLDEDRHHLFKIIEEFKPDVVHLQEIPEMFMPHEVASKLYNSNREYVIVETSHDSSYNVSNKVHFPDKFMMVSQYQINEYKKLNIPCELVEYPIEYKEKTKSREDLLKERGLDPNKKHVITVGLFTPRKNQAEVIEYARFLKDYPIQFHFIGNQADNFKHYWEPLMKDFPSNCKWWGERRDVDNFYQMADLFLFTSRGHSGDKETMPLVIREAISWKVPSLIYNLDVYLNYFDKFNNISYLDTVDKEKNCNTILKTLNMNENAVFEVWYTSSDNKVYFSSKDFHKDVHVSIKDIDSHAVLWSTEYKDFYPNIEYWILPTPKSYIDFEKDPTFGGLRVEFYKNNESIFHKEIRIKHVFIKKPVLEIKNFTEPTYINYVEFFVDKIYDKYLLWKDYNVIVDVGANIGLWIEYIKNTVEFKKIYAVEPNEKALEILNNSYKNDDRICIVDKAMSDKDGEMEFFVDQENSTISSAAQYGSLRSSYKVKSTSFKSFIKENKIEKVDLLKVDIETGEYPLFESLDADDFNIIDSILVEYHLIAGRSYKDVEDLKNKLTSAGYSLEVRDMHSIGGFIFASKTPLENMITNEKIERLLDTNLAPNKRDLASLVNKMFPDGRGVEIGVLRGDYSKLILERWPKGTLYLIDAWRHLEDYIDMNGQEDKYHYDCLIETCKNIKPWQDRAHIIRMDSVKSSDMFPDEYFDFIYIDADHSYEGVVKDLNAWWPKIKKGGLFCGDDYIPHDGDIWLTVGDKKEYAGKFGVRKAVNEFTEEKNLKLYETTEEPYWRQWYTFKPL
jgi:FkbM family methyltransferase